MSADSVLILLHTCASDDNHTLIFTPCAFKVSNHYFSLNLIGHIHIPTCATETVQQWPDPPFPALVMQYIQSWGGSGLVHETNMRAWIRVLDVPGYYKRTARAERKSVLQGSELVRTVGSCAQRRVPQAIARASDALLNDRREAPRFREAC